MTEAAPARRKGKANTQAAILGAAKEVLADEGFGGFGVNAVARQAQCDKQLIYRYFGGLEGLVEAIGTDLASELKAELSSVAENASPRNYAELIALMVKGLIHILRFSPIMRQINAWEVAAPSPLVERLAQARSQELLRWVNIIRGDLPQPTSIDFMALNAILLAAAQQLVLSSSAIGNYGAIPLRTEEDWHRVESAFTVLIVGTYPDENEIPEIS